MHDAHTVDSALWFRLETGRSSGLFECPEAGWKPSAARGATREFRFASHCDPYPPRNCPFGYVCVAPHVGHSGEFVLLADAGVGVEQFQILLRHVIFLDSGIIDGPSELARETGSRSPQESKQVVRKVRRQPQGLASGAAFHVHRRRSTARLARCRPD